MSKKSKLTAAIVVLLVLLGVFWSICRWDAARSLESAGASSDAPGTAGSALAGAQALAGGIRLTGQAVERLGVQVVEVKPAPPPEPLRLSGTTLLDPNSMVRIHARFPGELASMGNVSAGDARRGGEPGVVEPRPLQYSDRVFKGEVLAVVVSNTLGEKKSEFVDAISQLDIDAALLKRYEAVREGVLSERMLFEARRAVDADRINLEKAERTLRSWRLTEAELQELRDEAKRIQQRESKRDRQGDKTWAETVIRSPINGIIVEKNFNVGDLLDPSQDLFKIADLERVQAMANAREEDLPLLKSLKSHQRKWRVDIKADPHDVPIEGTFDIVGSIIDPTQHAGAVIGWLDNPEGRLSIGEFINATIDLPADPTLVEIPSSALIEEGGVAQVLVEIDPEEHEFAFRKVAVVSRGRERAYVRCQPTAAELADGAQPLKVGQRVITSGAVELAAQLKGARAPMTRMKPAANTRPNLSKAPRSSPTSRNGEKVRLREVREVRS